MTAYKKWEVKTGKNRGLYLALEKEGAIKFLMRDWAMLNDDFQSTSDLKRAHNVPSEMVILTTSVWSRFAMRVQWEAVTTQV